MKESFLIDMGLRIAERRKAMQLTQEKLAEKMGISLQSVSSIELGKKGIRPENLANLCVYLETTADYILYGKRSSTQMTDIVEKLSSLSVDEYAIVKSLIELLSKK
jgi:transcriptional regulator with XRE-family HTH domain